MLVVAADGEGADRVESDGGIEVDDIVDMFSSGIFDMAGSSMSSSSSIAPKSPPPDLGALPPLALDATLTPTDCDGTSNGLTACSAALVSFVGPK